MKKEIVIFLCTSNSARSQMAEGLLRHYAGDQLEVYSAGFEPKPINPFAIQVMDEVGIDIRNQYPKSTKEFMGHKVFGTVIIVCGHTDPNCPKALWIIPGTKKLDWGIKDPAGVEGTDEEQAAIFRQTRDQIDEKIKSWLGEREIEKG